MLFLNIMIVCWWNTGRVEKCYNQEEPHSASIRFQFSSTVKSGHGTFPLPQLCVYLSQPLWALRSNLGRQTHALIAYQTVWCSAQCRMCSFTAYAAGFALSFHCHSSSRYPSMHYFPFTSMYPSIHESIQLKQPTPGYPNLSQPCVPSLFCGADSHWAMLSSLMTVSSGAAPLGCLYGETACIKLFFLPTTCCTNRLLS